MIIICICLEPNCDCAFKINKELIIHLENKHSIKFDVEYSEFNNKNDFENWKTNIEATNNCAYVLKCRKSNTIGEIIYYKCNRSKNSYHLKNNDSTTRLLKSQGSCKMARGGWNGLNRPGKLEEAAQRICCKIHFFYDQYLVIILKIIITTKKTLQIGSILL